VISLIILCPSDFEADGGLLSRQPRALTRRKEGSVLRTGILIGQDISQINKQFSTNASHGNGQPENVRADNSSLGSLQIRDSVQMGYKNIKDYGVRLQLSVRLFVLMKKIPGIT